MFGLSLGRLGSVGRALAAWTTAQLWPLGATSPGMWIDPPTTASLYQDSAGTTAISAIGTVLDTSNPVGLVLDRKGNLELGTELVSNPGGPFVSTADCTAYNSTLSVVSGRLRSTATGASDAGVSVDLAGLVAGSWYTLTYTGYPGTQGNWIVYPTYNMTGSGNTETAPGTYQLRMLATGTTSTILFRSTGGSTAGLYTEFGSISVKEIPGISLSQATATSRPVASARKNLLVGTAALATQSVTVIAAQCVLSFTGTGTVTLSGTSTAGPLVGTGAADRVSLTFTPTAGSLTLTVSGSVTLAQLEYRA